MYKKKEAKAQQLWELNVTLNDCWCLQNIDLTIDAMSCRNRSQTLILWAKSSYKNKTSSDTEQQPPFGDRK